MDRFPDGRRPPLADGCEAPLELPRELLRRVQSGERHHLLHSRESLGISELTGDHRSHHRSDAWHGEKAGVSRFHLPRDPPLLLPDLLLEEFDLPDQELHLIDEGFHHATRRTAGLQPFCDTLGLRVDQLGAGVEGLQGPFHLLLGDFRKLRLLEDGQTGRQGGRVVQSTQGACQPGNQEIEIPVQLPLGIAGLLHDTVSDPAPLPQALVRLVPRGEWTLVPLRPGILGDAPGVDGVGLGLAEGAPLLLLEEEGVERPDVRPLLHEEVEEIHVVDSARLHSVGDGEVETVTEGLGVRPELVVSLRGIGIRGAGGDHVAETIQHGHLERLLRHVDSHVEAVHLQRETSERTRVLFDLLRGGRRVGWDFPGRVVRSAGRGLRSFGWLHVLSSPGWKKGGIPAAWKAQTCG